jgi:hypothetical protein
VQGLRVRGLKIQPSQEEEEGDYEEEDYDDNLSQENLREMYIAAVDLAIHRVSILSSSDYFNFNSVPIAYLLKFFYFQDSCFFALGGSPKPHPMSLPTSFCM